MKLKALYFVGVATAITAGIVLAGCTVVGNELCIVKQCNSNDVHVVHQKATTTIERSK